MALLRTILVLLTFAAPFALPLAAAETDASEVVVVVPNPEGCGNCGK